VGVVSQPNEDPRRVTPVSEVVRGSQAACTKIDAKPVPGPTESNTDVAVAVVDPAVPVGRDPQANAGLPPLFGVPLQVFFIEHQDRHATEVDLERREVRAASGRIEHQVHGRVDVRRLVEPLGHRLAVLVPDQPSVFAANGHILAAVHDLVEAHFRFEPVGTLCSDHRGAGKHENGRYGNGTESTDCGHGFSLWRDRRSGLVRDQARVGLNGCR
jgi:hypothetical protein